VLVHDDRNRMDRLMGSNTPWAFGSISVVAGFWK